MAEETFEYSIVEHNAAARSLMQHYFNFHWTERGRNSRELKYLWNIIICYVKHSPEIVVFYGLMINCFVLWVLLSNQDNTNFWNVMQLFSGIL